MLVHRSTRGREGLLEVSASDLGNWIFDVFVHLGVSVTRVGC